MEMTKQVAPRKPSVFDAELELRAASAAAITTTGADPTSPDYESAVKTLGFGNFIGRVVIQNLALTLNVANDSAADILVIGLNEAADEQVVLGRLRLGCKEMTGETNDNATGDTDIDIPFQTVMRGKVWPKLKLAVVTQGTTISVDFTAFIAHLIQAPVPSM